jgi:hypothetical protein
VREREVLENPTRPLQKGAKQNPNLSPRFRYQLRPAFFHLSIVFQILSHTLLTTSNSMGQKRAKPTEELEADQIRQTMPFYPPRCSKIRAGKLEGWVADETNEHVAMLLMDARDIEPRTRLNMHIFACFLMADVVPLLSSFLSAILESMGSCCRSFT